MGRVWYALSTTFSSKKKGRRLAVWGIIFMMMLQTFSITAYAVGDIIGDGINAGSNVLNGNTSSGGGQSGSNNADLIAAIKAIVPGHSDEDLEIMAETVALVVGGLQSKYTPEAIAGVLCNMYYESAFDPYAWEGYGTSNRFACYKSGKKDWSYDVKLVPGKHFGGCGLAQWTYTRHSQVSNYCKSNDPNSVRIKCAWYTSSSGGPESYDTYLGNAGTQVAYLITDTAWNDHTAKVGAAGITRQSYTTMTDAVKAAQVWCVCYETPGDFVKTAKDRSVSAPAWLNIVKGNYNWESYVTEGNAQAMGSQLVSAGYWSEDELASYMKLIEPAITFDDAKRENLSQNELSGLAAWERNVHEDLEKGGLINFIRRLVMFFGIIFTVWVAFIYMAYWFDRVNNFFYIDLLGVMTLGHLHMSETEKECTFHIRDLGKEGRKTVNHRAILFICLVGIAFGVFIVSGTYYYALQAFVNLIKRILGSF